MDSPISWDFQMLIFILCSFAWWAEFVFFPAPARKKRGRTSFLIIVFSIFLVVGLSIIFTRLKIGVVAETPGTIMRNVGLLIYIMGLIFRYWSIRELGDLFTRGTEVEKSQTLISTGLYNYLRHPLYLGLFLLTTGLPVFLQNFPVSLLAIFLMFFSLNNRMLEEEALMEEIIGERYQEWKKQRYRFFPFIY